MKTFETGLREAILAKPKLTARERRILAVIDAPPSKRKERRLARMENHARAAMNIAPNKAEVDWGSFDWSKILTMILELLIKLLPLILA